MRTECSTVALLSAVLCLASLAGLPAVAHAQASPEALGTETRLDLLGEWPASVEEAVAAESFWFVTPSRGAVQRESDIFLDFYGAFAVGLGGWQDRSYTASDPENGSYESEQSSFLQGIVGNLSVGVQAAEGIAPMLRFSVGGGRHSYSHPGRGPEASQGYDEESNRRVRTTFGRFSVGLGLHFEADVSANVTLFANVGFLFAFPFDETWTFRRSNPRGEQLVTTRYEIGLGGFGDGGLLIWASSQRRFAFRFGVFLEGVNTSFKEQRFHEGSGAYEDEPSGTIRFDTGDFADDEEFDEDGNRRVHKSHPLGFEGSVGAWGFTLGVQIWF